MIVIEAKGAKVPALGLGTYGMWGGTCVAAVRFALELGYRHVDTAQMYENEAEVGQGIADSGIARAEIFLTTKVLPRNLGADDLQRSADASLARLKTDYVDLLLVHWPNPAIPLGETLGAIAQVKAEGKARHIGVSNFTVALLDAAVADHGADLLANQVEYHPYLSQKPVLACLNRHGMMLTAYRPVTKGETNDDPVLARIGDKYGKTGAQVALRWLIEQDRVAAIPKAASREHCRSNFDIFDFSLDASDAAAIAALTDNRRYLDPAWAPAWDPPE